jgi:hypothetical protein
MKQVARKALLDKAKASVEQVKFCLACSSTRKMTIYSSKISVDFQRTAERYFPEYKTLHNHLCENLIFTIISHISWCGGTIFYHSLLHFRFSSNLTYMPPVEDMYANSTSIQTIFELNKSVAITIVKCVYSD